MSVELSPIVLDIEYDASGDIDKFHNIFGERKVVNLQDKAAPADLSGIKYALVWKPDPGLFGRMPDLEVLFSVGAGVDHIMDMDNVPDVPIVRFVDPSLTHRMSEWVCLQCLLHLRTQRFYDANQRDHRWMQASHPTAKELRVGIMGLGVLGLDAARKLKAIGFDVAGWSRSRKQIDGIDTFDATQLDAFLARTEILIGLLPSTPGTTGFFNRALFSQLVPQSPIGGPVFINAGRGKSQVEVDIVECLEDGTLGGVSLDVFETEPLPQSNRLWDFENAYLTPHSAAESNASAMAKYVSGQIDRYEAGQELENLVDREAGY